MISVESWPQPAVRAWVLAQRFRRFLIVGAAVLVPTILVYTGYAYWVFRGKVDPEEGYH